MTDQLDVVDTSWVLVPAAVAQRYGDAVSRHRVEVGTEDITRLVRLS